MHQKVSPCTLNQFPTESHRRVFCYAEKMLAPIAKATRRKKNSLRGKKGIAIRVGKVINKYKVGKHFKALEKNSSFVFFELAFLCIGKKPNVLFVRWLSIYFLQQICHSVSFSLLMPNGLCMKRWAFRSTSFSVCRKFYLSL